MITRTLPRLFALSVGLLTGGAALAQSGACQRYRAELASIDRGGSSGFAAAVQQQRSEIARLAGYYHSLGCDRGFSFFSGAPMECGAIAQRIRLMQATYNQIAVRADPYGDQARRRQLLAAIEQACSPESLHAERRRRQQELEQRRVRLQDDEEDDDRKRPTGGSRIVCVRACDGYFFPLHNLPDGRGGADQMCKALCPGAEAAAYSMPGGDGEIEEAVSLKSRKPYVQLANAFKFQKSFDPACSCKAEGQTWAQALQKAEKMLDRHRGDIIVTAAKAEELSRPKSIRTANRTRKPETKPQAEPGPRESFASNRTEVGPVATAAKAAQTAVDVDSTGSVAAVPTASKASSGIGPQSIESPKAVAQDEGPEVELKDDEGVKRKVRIVAPNVIPVPKIEAP
jgi:hypothetical protein